MESSAENEASQRPAQSGDDGGAGGDTAPSSIHNNTQDDDDVVVVVPRRPTDEKKVVTQEERRRDDVMIPEDSRVLSVSMYVGFPPKESNFVEIQREVALPSLPIKRIKPVYKSVGLGVIPKDDEYQWPSVSKRPRLGRNRTGETLGNDEADNASPQYARRRTRQNPNYEDETLSEPDWRDKGGNTRSTSRVGARYQVDALPKAGTAEYDNSNNTEMGDVLWDAVAANRARTTVGNLDAFLGKNRQLPVKMLLMQALHDVGYDTSRATQVFVQLVHSDRTRAELVLSEIQTYELHDIFRNQVEKDFNSIAHATGHSMDTVLVEYYKWKGSRRREHQRIKKTRRSSASNDYCEICNDGGSLILCELCRKAFHIECLDPPLEKVPDDLWYCDNCKIRSPARVRSLHHVASPGSEKSERKGVTRSPPDANSVIHGVTNARELPPRDPNGYYLAEIRNDPRLYISIGFDTTDHQLVFTGYQRSENGKMGQAELKNAFETPGDAICAVNGTRITGLGWRGASAVIDEAKRKSSRLIFLMKRRPQIVMPPRSSTIIATPLGPSVEPASTSNRAIVPSPQGKTETRVCAVANIPNSDAMNASQLAPGRASNDPVATVPSGTTNGSSIGRPQTAVDASKDPTIQLMAASNRANNNVGTTAESYDAVANMAARNRPNSDAARMAGSLPAAVNAAPNGFNSDSVRMAGLQPAMANTAAPNHLYNNGVRATESWPSVANTVVPNQPHKLSSGASNVNLANSSNIGVGGVVGSLPGLANMTAPNGINSDGARASTMQGALSRSSNGETASVANDSVKLNHQPTGFTQGVMRGGHLSSAGYQMPQFHPYNGQPREILPRSIPYPQGMALTQHISRMALGGPAMQMNSMPTSTVTDRIGQNTTGRPDSGKSIERLGKSNSNVGASLPPAGRKSDSSQTNVRRTQTRVEMSLSSDEKKKQRSLPPIAEPKGYSPNGSKTPVPHFVQYIARVPVTDEGLCLIISERNGVPCFNGYRPLSNGQDCPAMQMNPQPFRNKGDEIVAIDSSPVKGMNYNDVIDLLKNNGNKQVRILRMRTPTGTNNQFYC